MRLPADPPPAGSLLTLAEAQHLCVAAVERLGTEEVDAGDAVGRSLAGELVALYNQPPFEAAAMDGFAVRFDELASTLTVVGEAAAGHPFARALAPGEAVRIGTGAAVPSGADHILIKEDARCDGDRLIASAKQVRRGNIRAAGRDFEAGAGLLDPGSVLQPWQIGLLAASGRAKVSVVREPRVGVLTSGDELVTAGLPLGPAQVVDSASVGLPALIGAWGGSGQWIGRAPDEPHACQALWSQASGFDLLVTVGGASVGDRDVLRASLVAAGGVVEWAGVAIRPGKPCWGGRIGDTPVLGLPGNPAAALVAARLLLRPVLAAMLGRKDGDDVFTGHLASGLPQNGWRQGHERARHRIADDGTVRLTAEGDADSSRLSPFARCDALIERPPNAAASETGERVAFRLI